MIKFFKRRPPRVDPAELDRQTAEVNEYIEKEGPRLSAMAQFLKDRKNQNGIGEDFEVTLRPRGA